MGRDLCQEYETARNIYRTAGEVLGYDIEALSFDGPEEQLNLTRQLHILTLEAPVETGAEAPASGDPQPGEAAE